MRFWIPIFALFLALLAFSTGCGGGGTGSTGGPDPIVRYAVEAVKGGVVIDPTNIAVGEVVQFQVAGYTAAHQRIVQGASGWTLDPTGQTQGTLTGSGQFTATASGSQFTVSATAAGSLRTGVARVVSSGQAFVEGRITDGFGNPVWGVTIDFYTAGGSLVGSSISQGNGNFRGAVPTTASTFEARHATIPSTHYKQYFYNTKWYLPNGFCRAPLPGGLVVGQTRALVGDVVIPPTSSAPPPPPSACP